MKSYKKIAIIGGGNLGSAMASGIINSQFCKAEYLTVTRRNTESLKNLKNKGVNIITNNCEAVKNSNVIILAIKPYQIAHVIQEILPYITESQLLVSVVTGVSLEDLNQMIPIKLPIFRAMPNTAIAIGDSMTCISHSNSNKNEIEYIESLFQTVGKSVNISDGLMDAATVLGACGTAFALRYIRANIQGGIEIGFDSQTATLIASQTVKGAANLILKIGSHPEQEIDKVTTPKGCTIAGLNEMEHQGFSSSLIKGISTSFKKIISL